MFILNISYIITVIIRNKQYQIQNTNIKMLFGGRSTSPNITQNSRQRQQGFQKQSSRSPIKKQQYKQSKNNSMFGASNSKQIKTGKTKDYMGILYTLEDIHNQLSFNDYDAFAQQRIIQARKNIDRLLTFYKNQPICPKHHDILNLYCENQKQIICVSCVYKGNQQHKNHKIKPIQSVAKSIDYEVIRLEEKSKSLVAQLSLIQEDIINIEKDICQNFMNISNNSVAIINESIKQLQNLKQQYNSKLSVSYRRTNTIIKRYSQSLSLLIDTLEVNLQKASTMKGLSKYLLLKQINKQNFLMEELVGKYNDNKVLMEQWKKAMKDTEKIMVKKKVEQIKSQKQDIYIVTKF